MIGGAMDKALADVVSTFSKEGVHIPARITPRVRDILTKEMEWRSGIDKLIQGNRGGSPLGYQTPEQVQEDLDSFKRWELHQELKHEDRPNFERDMRQDREIARMNANSKWAMQRLMPIYEKHGMAEQHAGTTDEYGFPAYAHAITHPNFRPFVKDFIAFHTAENKKHWAEKGKASSYHWPAILRARQGLESLQRREEYMANQKQTPGDLSESVKNRIINSLLENSKDVGDWAGLGQDEMTSAAYEEESREKDISPQETPAELNHKISLEVHGHHGAVSSIADSWKSGILSAEEAMKMIHERSTQTSASLRDLRKRMGFGGPSSD